MRDPTSCPDVQILGRLKSGQLPLHEVNALVEHVKDCPHCLDTVQNLTEDDTLLGVLREPAPSEVEDHLLSALLQRLEGLLTSSSDARATVSHPLGVHANLAEPLWLGGYRIRGRLGQGGMGIVYLADDPDLERSVALKVMRPELACQDVARQRFLREAKALAALKHAHIATIYRVGEDGGTPFLAMELLHGESLETRLQREGRLTPGEVLRIGRQVASGLAAAHAAGLIHRDVKPGNIWLETPTRTVKLLDFGLARGVQDSLELTSTNAVLGTPAYMSPEQAESQPLDARSDLFSLGVVLFRACTGELPFKGKHSLAVLKAVTESPAVPPRTLNPEVPAILEALILRLLAKVPSQRPASADSALQELARVDLEPDDRRARTPVKSRKLWLAAVVVLATVLGLAWLWRPKPPPPDSEKVMWSQPGVLVPRPVVLPGVLRWTIEPVSPRSGILAVAYSPDGNWLASADGSAMIRLRRLRDDTVRLLLSSALTPQRLAWCSDSKRLAVAGNSVEVWNVETGQLLRTLERVVHDIAWAPDRHRLAIAEARYTTVWNTETWEEVNRAEGTGRLAYSPDGKILATTTSKVGVRLSSATTLGVQREIARPQGYAPLVVHLAALAWSADGKYLALARGKGSGGDGWLCIVDVERGVVLPLETEGNRTGHLAWAPRGHLLAASTDSGPERRRDYVEVIDAATGKYRQHFNPATDGWAGVGPLSWSPDNNTIAVGGMKNAALYLHSLSTSATKCIGKGGVRNNTLIGLSWSPDGLRLGTFFGGEENEHIVAGWDAAQGNRLALTDAEQQRILSSPNGKLYALPAPKGDWFRTEIFLRQPLTDRALTVSNRGVYSWSPKGDVVAVEDGEKVRIWDAATGKERKALLIGGTPSALAISADGNTLIAAVEKEPRLRFYDIASGKLVREVAVAAVQSLACSPDGKFLAIGYQGATHGELRSADGEQVRHTLPVGGINVLSWSPDSKTLASGPSFPRLWEATTGRQLASLLPLDRERGLAVSADGHFAGVSVEDKDIRYIIETEMGQETLTAAEFLDRYQWNNDRKRVRLTAP